jgi:hypothetical protein
VSQHQNQPSKSHWLPTCSLHGRHTLLLNSSTTSTRPIVTALHSLTLLLTQQLLLLLLLLLMLLLMLSMNSDLMKMLLNGFQLYALLLLILCFMQCHGTWRSGVTSVIQTMQSYCKQLLLVSCRCSR